MALSGIISDFKRVSGLMHDIASATREQSLGIDQVSKAVTLIDGVTQRNASQTRDLTATAIAVSRVAEQLTGAVARLRLPTAAALGCRPRCRPLGRPAPLRRRLPPGRHTGWPPRSARVSVERF